MEHRDPEHLDERIDAYLRAHRPTADRDFVQRLEGKLFAPPRREPAPLRLGLAFAGALATLLLVLSLAGTGPLSRDQMDVRADRECTTKLVTKQERTPFLIERPGAEPRIVYRSQEVTQTVQTCR